MIWIYVLFGILSMFLSSGGKKPSAKDAAIGVAAGLGTYAIGTQTEWGKSTVASIESALGGANTVTAPDPSGVPKTVVTDSSGGVLAGLGAGVAANAKTLVPIALAAGAGTAVASSGYGKYLLWGGIGLAAYLLFIK